MLETIAAIGGALGGLGQAAGGAAGLFGGGSNNSGYWQQLGIMREQAQLQREFAQNGIQWRVQDAKAAGIHPLYALGGSGATYSPSGISVGGGTGSDLGRDLANMGQGLGRAVAAASSKEDRADAAYQSQMRIMGLERASLENRLLETQIAASQGALMRAQVGPGIPTGPSLGGIPGHGVYSARPAEVTTANPSRPGSEAGPQRPGGRYIQMQPGGNGGPTVVASLPAESMNMDELTSPGTASWQFWNSIMPFISADARNAARPPNSMLPQGATHWRWTPFGYVAQYPTIPGRDLRAGRTQHYLGPRASTRRISPSGAER